MTVSCYLMKGVLEEQGKKLHHRELSIGLDSSKVNTYEQAQKVCELLHVTVSREGNIAISIAD